MVVKVERHGCRERGDENPKEEEDEVHKAVLERVHQRCPDKHRENDDDRCLDEAPYRDEEDLGDEDTLAGHRHGKELV